MSARSRIGRVFATAAVAAMGLAAFGETLTWTGEVSSDWAEAGNWSPAQAPAAGDALVIPAELEVYPQLAPVNWPETGSYASLTVAAGAKIVCLGDKADDGLGRGPWITADEMLIDGTLDAVGQGFRNRTGKGTDGRCCSASHGGLGSWMWRYWQTWPNQGASPYGDCAAPVALGSSTSTAGGGAVKLVSSGTITVNGTIDASAEDKKGASSGGSVWIVCETLAGASSGRIRANGSPTPDSHGGAGGRVALDYSTKTYAGTVTVDCTPNVAAYYLNGMPGTIYEPKRYPIGTPEEPAEVTLSGKFTYVFPDDGQTRYWKLTVSGGAVVGLARGKLNLASLTFAGWDAVLSLGRWCMAAEESCEVEGEGLKSISLANRTRLMLPGAEKQATWNFESLTVPSGCYLYFGGADLDNDRGTVVNVSGDATIGGEVSVSMTGSTSTMGKKGSATAGGAYGGMATYIPNPQQSYTKQHNDPYGSLSAPISAGAAGCSTSASGGALQLNVEGTLSLNGSIVAKGYEQGSGGSVWICATRTEGTGSISAAGGQGTVEVGAGGRVAIEVKEGLNELSAGAGGQRSGQSGIYDRIGYPGTVFRSTGPWANGFSSEYATSGVTPDLYTTLGFELPPRNSTAADMQGKALVAERVVSLSQPAKAKYAWTERTYFKAGDVLTAVPNTVTYTISDLTPNTKYTVTHNGEAQKIRADADGKLVFSAEFQNGLEPDSFAVNGPSGFVLRVR